MLSLVMLLDRTGSNCAKLAVSGMSMERRRSSRCPGEADDRWSIDGFVLSRCIPSRLRCVRLEDLVNRIQGEGLCHSRTYKQFAVLTMRSIGRTFLRFLPYMTRRSSGSRLVADARPLGPSMDPKASQMTYLQPCPKTLMIFVLSLSSLSTLVSTSLL